MIKKLQTETDNSWPIWIPIKQFIFNNSRYFWTTTTTTTNRSRSPILTVCERKEFESVGKWTEYNANEPEHKIQ